ncbi:MAG: molybdopterin-synthase adenylyltransferase MoeB [Deltaproteobacteria bacterium]|jgi:molybdopterin/thiamine biosynthesis adenylyltransferase|nr:molybdopterin-synthase adenylyltransferase MoeB [Deltaproteobacteria bacterium]
MTLIGGQLERYSRNVLIEEIGVKGQKKLLKGSVLVIGVGGLGSPAALYLAAAGVGTIGLVDSQTVDLTNLQRQIIHSTRDLGSPKTESGRNSVLALNPELDVKTFKFEVTAANILDLIKDFDFIIDGTDNFAAKFLINDACVIAQKPFCHAGVIRFQGQITSYLPGQGPCVRCLLTEPPPVDSLPTCGQSGILGAIAGVVGSLEALEAIKFLTGAGSLLTGQLLTYDGLTMDFRKVKYRHRPDCPVCGDNPTIVAPLGIKKVS